MMIGYSIRHKLGGVYHITSTVLNQCPTIARGDSRFGNWSVDYVDTPQAALDMIAKWGGRVCKNCRKNVEAVINDAPAYNFAPLGAGREMPSLEEIASETPLPVPVPVPVVLTAVITAAEREQAAQEFAAAVLEKGKSESETTRNREAWLTDAVEAVTALFTEQGHKVPAVRISVGWPGGKGKKGLLQTIGQCWYAHHSADGLSQIFISPLLDDAVRILDVVIHELVHAVAGGACGHRGAFKKIAVSVGLEGKMTATVAGDKLRGRLVELAAGLGEYPHAKLTPSAAPTTAAGRNRQLKVMCDCGNIARQSRQAIDTYGTPICRPCGTEMYEA